MMLRTFIDRQWRIMRWSWLASLIALSVIVLINFGYAYSNGEPLPWSDVAAALGIAIFGTGIVWVARRWFNFVAGSEVCKWRADR